MKCKVCLFSVIFLANFLYSQSPTISISGRLNNKDNAKVIHLQNLDSIKIPISIHNGNSFSIVKNNVLKGFYEVDEIGSIYLCPGYQLSVKPASNGLYYFTGSGAVENNALQATRKQLVEYLPLGKDGELDSSAYFIDVDVFLQKLDSFQRSSTLILNKSTDTFFLKYATLNLEFYTKHLLSLYFAYYGVDRQKMMTLPDVMRKLDRKTPDYVAKATSFMKSTHLKEMDISDRQKLAAMLYSSWDKNNETLFKNSVWYREAFQNFFTYAAYTPKYFKLVKPAEIKREDADIKKLTIAKGEISNSYILSYFNYTITNSILQTSRDTPVINKVYKEYVSSATSEDYLSNIKNTYNNIVTFKDNKPAPSFTYNDVSGKAVSLEKLKGKYVYIDVWATWCGPCKGEIPDLKKIEEAYHDKNIQFVSISVDEPANKTKWREFVKKNNLKGTQLITDNAFETSFIKKMSINSIPRFILIDPAGKIVSADALRPSNPELRNLFDKLL
jgi:thiol-disulfide isomerase/thioredoxin